MGAWTDKNQQTVAQASGSAKDVLFSGQAWQFYNVSKTSVFRSIRRVGIVCKNRVYYLQVQVC